MASGNFMNFNGFVSRNIRNGLKLHSFIVFFRTLLLVKFYLRTRVDSASFLFIIVNKLRPWIHFQISRFKPSLVYIPKVLSYGQSMNYAYRWFFDSVRSRAGYSFVLQFFIELIYTFYNKSGAALLRKQTHLLAFGYKKNLKVNRSRTVRYFSKPV